MRCTIWRVAEKKKKKGKRGANLPLFKGGRREEKKQGADTSGSFEKGKVVLGLRANGEKGKKGGACWSRLKKKRGEGKRSSLFDPSPCASRRGSTEKRVGSGAKKREEGRSARLFLRSDCQREKKCATQFRREGGERVLPFLRKGGVRKKENLFLFSSSWRKGKAQTLLFEGEGEGKGNRSFYSHPRRGEGGRKDGARHLGKERCSNLYPLRMEKEKGFFGRRGGGKMPVLFFLFSPFFVCTLPKKE